MDQEKNEWTREKKENGKAQEPRRANSFELLKQQILRWS